MTYNNPEGVFVQYWEKREIPLDNRGNGIKGGWFCWVFVDHKSDFDFPGWMEKCCPTAEYEFRFNSGNPMYTVCIPCEKEAMIFKLKWNPNGK